MGRSKPSFQILLRMMLTTNPEIHLKVSYKITELDRIILILCTRQKKMLFSTFKTILILFQGVCQHHCPDLCADLHHFLCTESIKDSISAPNSAPPSMLDDNMMKEQRANCITYSSRQELSFKKTMHRSISAILSWGTLEIQNQKKQINIICL